MENDYIAVIDSGIGGLSVLKRLVDVLPSENYVYFGDNKNVPYGNKSDRELLSITINNFLRLKSQFNLKAIVLGCNTLSMTIRRRVEEIFDIKVFGVFPPVVFYGNKKTLLLSTERTAIEYQKYNPNVVIKIMPDLAKNIESVAPNFSSIDVKSILPYKKGEFNSVILGCTHYDFVKNEIFDHLRPQYILCGQDCTANCVKNFYKNIKSLDNSYRNQVLFFGDNAKKNKNIWNLVVKDVKFYDKKM